MAERSNAAVLKTVEVKASGGSNPSLSAFAQRSISVVGFFLFCRLRRTSPLEITLHSFSEGGLFFKTILPLSHPLPNWVMLLLTAGYAAVPVQSQKELLYSWPNSAVQCHCLHRKTTCCVNAHQLQ
jgi:hypothetical protein